MEIQNYQEDEISASEPKFRTETSHLWQKAHTPQKVFTYDFSDLK